mgnify:CR=1 FL=1
MSRARRDLQSTGFAVEGLEEFERALRKAPDRLAKALWVGNRRSLASFRREFLKRSGAKIRGTKQLQPGAGQRREKLLGQSFQWRVYPINEANVKAGVRPTGELFTRSFAAHGLEVGGRVRPKSGKALWLPIGQGYGDNTTSSGKIKQDWKSIGRVFKTKRGRYKLFPVKTKRGATVIYAIRRGPKKKRKKDGTFTKAFERRRAKLLEDTGIAREKSFPIFIKQNTVGTKKGRLRFFRLWGGYGAQVQRRFEQELRKAIREIATDRKEPRSALDS